MSIQHIFRGAVPYDEAIQRLNKAFPNLKAGDLLSHADIAKVAQCEVKSLRYQGIKQAWMRHVLRNRGLVLSGEGRARGVGLMAVTGLEETELTKGWLGHVNKQAKRRSLRTQAIDTAGMTDRQLAEVTLVRRETASIAAVTMSANKALRTPGPTEGNVRVLKPSA